MLICLVDLTHINVASQRVPHGTMDLAARKAVQRPVGAAGVISSLGPVLIVTLVGEDIFVMEVRGIKGLFYDLSQK